VESPSQKEQDDGLEEGDNEGSYGVPEEQEA
jgi:hypothetical protein